MENKLQNIIDFLNDSIAEMYEYANSDDYDDLEQHDCRIAAEAYEFVLNHVKKLM
jgi:hypothetical protein